MSNFGKSDKNLLFKSIVHMKFEGVFLPLEAKSDAGLGGIERDVDHAGISIIIADLPFRFFQQRQLVVNLPFHHEIKVDGIEVIHDFKEKNECNLQAHLIRKLLRCSVTPSSRRASTAPGRYLQGISTGRCPLSSCLLQGDPGPRSYSSKVPWPACPAVSFSFRNLPGLQGYGNPRPCQITTRS